MGAQIVNISNYGACAEQRLEAWLKEEMIKQYGEYNEIRDNRLLRICTKFDAMDSSSQNKVFDYAERCMLDQVGGLSIRDRFWNILEKVGGTSWKDIEKYADKLLVKELEPTKSCEMSECNVAEN